MTRLLLNLRLLAFFLFFTCLLLVAADLFEKDLDLVTTSQEDARLFRDPNEQIEIGIRRLKKGAKRARIPLFNDTEETGKWSKKGGSGREAAGAGSKSAKSRRVISTKSLTIPTNSDEAESAAIVRARRRSKKKKESKKSKR